MAQNFWKTSGKTAFTILLLIFAVAFFVYKQYWLAFFTLALILVFSRWDQVKKIVVGKDKVEVQIPESVVTAQEKSKIKENAG